MKSKTCLLITPKRFYSFEKLITNALEEQGYLVSVANDEYPMSLIGKVIGKLQLPIVFKKTSNHIQKHFLSGNKFDLALIIKGRGMSNQLIDQIKLNSTTVIGYNWDSFKYNRSPLRWYKNVHRYCTFDFDDANKYSIPIVELFSSLPRSLEAKVVSIGISAIFRNHSERLQYLDHIINNIETSALFIYIYEQNTFTFIFNFLKSPLLYSKYWKYIKFKPLDYNSYLEVLKNSEFTVDYAHSDQSGITMRCYEAISMNTRIITNNASVKSSKYFNESNSIVQPLKGSSKALVDSYVKCKSKSFDASCRNINDFLLELTTTN